MSAKIFLPEELFYIKEDCNLYGEIKINENNAVSYFVVAGVPAKYQISRDETFEECAEICGLRYLGHILENNSKQKTMQYKVQSDVALSFLYDKKTQNIYLPKLSIKSETAKTANIFLYDPVKVLQLHVSIEDSFNNDMYILYRLVKSTEGKLVKEAPYASKLVSSANLLLLLPLEIMTRVFAYLMETIFAKQTIQQMVFYEHYQEWKMYQLSRQRVSNIIVDRILGICGMLLLLFYISHPEEYLMQAANIIITIARAILANLKGNPVGLKLNTHLNNFLLDCFNYHIDLWEAFLNLIAPFMNQLFVIMALFGSVGISYQLALLADLISVIGLHAHCFYVYTAV